MLWYKEKRIGRLWIHGGIMKSFGIGFIIDKHHFSIDFCIFWLALEF